MNNQLKGHVFFLLGNINPTNETLSTQSPVHQILQASLLNMRIELLYHGQDVLLVICLVRL